MWYCMWYKMPTEKNWTEMFAYELNVPKVVTSAAKKCRCGNESCKRAKKIRCVCSCHALHHGEEQRRGMEPLDKVLGLKAEQATIGDLALDLELSGRFDA
jgi:hypothetical protein